MDLFSFLNRKSNSGNTAKSRLQLVLIQDRLNCSARVLEMMKVDIIAVISKYLDIDEEDLDIKINDSMDINGKKGSPVLFANIPIKSVKKEENEMKEENGASGRQ